MEREAASSPHAPPAILMVCDGVALLAFVAAGMRSHHEGALWWVFARNAIPLLTAWAVFAALFHTYRRRDLGSLLRTWLVAVPVALVVRSVWVGSPTGGRFVTFLVVGMAFTLLFLLLGRAAASGISRIGRPKAPPRMSGRRPKDQ